MTRTGGCATPRRWSAPAAGNAQAAPSFEAAGGRGRAGNTRRPGALDPSWAGRLGGCWVHTDTGGVRPPPSGFDSAGPVTYRVPRLGEPSRLHTGSDRGLPLSPPTRGPPRARERGRGWCGKPPGLTPRSQPRNVSRVAPETSRKAVEGARPLLENSTACQKSVPTNPVRGSGAISRSFPHIAADSFGTTSEKLVKTSDHAVVSHDGAS